MMSKGLGAPASSPAVVQEPTRTSALPETAARPALTPRLRFPEFLDQPRWEAKELHSIADPVSERADNADSNNILTLSGEHGLVLQSEYFGKQIAGTNSERYLKIQRDDFVYNDRTTKASEYGTIKRLSQHPHGIVSPIYKCFRFHWSELPGFWEWYFESGAHEAQLRSLANEGARAGRFNVSIDRFLATSAYAPEPGSGEQQKIAECLSTLDELIVATSQKLDALKAHKKGLMQQLFPREGETLPRLRFPEFQDAPEWEENPIGDLKPYVTSGSRGWAAFYADRGELFVRMTNLSRDSIYLDLSDSKFVNLPSGTNEGLRTQLQEHDVLISITADIGIIGYADGRIPTPAYINQHIALVRFDATEVSGRFAAYFLATDQSRRVFHVSTDAGTKAGMSLPGINKIKISLPRAAEQQRIASCLSSLDELIAARNDKLEALKTHKKGLMQQLFPSPAEAEA